MKLPLQNTNFYGTKIRRKYYLLGGSSLQMICRACVFVSKMYTYRCDEWLTRYDAANLMKFGIFQKLKNNMLYYPTILMITAVLGPKDVRVCAFTTLRVLYYYIILTITVYTSFFVHLYISCLARSHLNLKCLNLNQMCKFF